MCDACVPSMYIYANSAHFNNDCIAKRVMNMQTSIQRRASLSDLSPCFASIILRCDAGP
jgi:hypothetical protein